MLCLPMDEPLPPGLYIVATPIGNLSDLGPRAAEVLRRCDRVLAEDKRVSAKLLAHIGATAPMTAYHDHSGEAERGRIVATTPLGVRRVEVKTTSGAFQRRIHVSLAELEAMAGPEPYDVYRVYGFVEGIGGWLRVASNPSAIVFFFS